MRMKEERCCRARSTINGVQKSFLVELILTALTLLFSTCAGRDAVSAIVSGKNESVGSAVVFGVISFLCYLGFRKYSQKVDELFGDKKKDKENKKDEEGK